MSAEYTLIQLLLDSDIVIQDNQNIIVRYIRNFVNSLHYHSRRLAFKIHAVRYNKLQLVPNPKRKEKGAASHILSIYFFHIEAQIISFLQ